MAKSKSKRSPRRKTSLAAFFRKLWSKPGLLERFSESPEGRGEVLRQFNLSAKHKKILIGGCMRDIIRELAGVKYSTETMTVINAAAVDCGHPECKAFTKAAKPR
jgi:hypothetical protein